MSHLETLKSVLTKYGYSITKSRAIIFEQLLKQSPISAAKLADSCKLVNRSTIYRTLDLFEQLAIVKRIWIGFKNKYELTDRFDPHHHHLSCLNCRRVFSVKEPALERLLNKISHTHGVRPVDHQVEITGYCRHCLKAATFTT